MFLQQLNKVLRRVARFELYSLVPWRLVLKFFRFDHALPYVADISVSLEPGRLNGIFAYRRYAANLAIWCVRYLPLPRIEVGMTAIALTSFLYRGRHET